MLRRDYSLQMDAEDDDDENNLEEFQDKPLTMIQNNDADDIEAPLLEDSTNTNTNFDISPPP
jgi:hypothetical protein